MNSLTTHLRPRRSRRKAFTLIELLLVLVILAILTSVVAVKVVGTTQKAKIAAAKTTLAALNDGLKHFEIDNGRYPTSEEGLNALVQNPGNLTDWKQGYVDKLLPDPWGTPYIYRCPGTNGADYDLLSCGPDKTEGGGDDITP